MTTRYETTVERVEWCGDDIIVIGLARPEGYEFAAGQWFRLFVTTDEGEQARTLSHAGTPGEAELLLATRLSDSAFKRALAGVDVGDTLTISASGGRLALPSPPHLTVLTGGVGVTPVRSLLKAAVDAGRAFEDALIVYGVRDDRCAPFVDVFESMASAGVRLSLVCERPGPEWRGDTGFITAEIVDRLGGFGAGRPFVVTGPPAMVEAMDTVMDELGVAAEDRIVERFGSARTPE